MREDDSWTTSFSQTKRKPTQVPLIPHVNLDQQKTVNKKPPTYKELVKQNKQKMIHLFETQKEYVSRKMLEYSPWRMTITQTMYRTKLHTHIFKFFCFWRKYSEKLRTRFDLSSKQVQTFDDVVFLGTWSYDEFETMMRLVFNGLTPLVSKGMYYILREKLEIMMKLVEDYGEVAWSLNP